MSIFHVSSKKGLDSIDASEIKKHLSAKTGFILADFENPKLEEIELLRAEFGFNSAVIENILEGYLPPVFINNEYHAFLLKVPGKLPGSNLYRTMNLGILLSEKSVILIRDEKISWLETILESLNKKPEMISDSPWLFVYRLAKRILSEANSIILSWENLLNDLPFEEETSYSEWNVERFLKIKLAAENLSKDLMDISEMIEINGEEIKRRLKGGKEKLEAAQFTYRWEASIERAIAVRKRIDNAVETFQNVGLQRQRKIFEIMLNLNLLFLPIIAILVLSSLILPSLDLPANIKTIVWPSASLLLGAIIGAGLLKGTR